MQLAAEPLCSKGRQVSNTPHKIILLLEKIIKIYFNYIYIIYISIHKIFYKIHLQNYTLHIKNLKNIFNFKNKFKNIFYAEILFLSNLHPDSFPQYDHKGTNYAVRDKSM